MKALNIDSMKVTIFHEDGTERWNLKITLIPTEDGNKFKVEDDVKYSLFNSDDWEMGDTPGEALDNFMKVEKELLESL